MESLFTNFAVGFICFLFGGYIGLLLARKSNIKDEDWY